MKSIVIFIAVAGLAYLIMRAFLSRRAPPNHALEQLNDPAPLSDDLSAYLASEHDLVRRPDGSYKSKSDIEVEKVGWDEWRTTLTYTGITGVKGVKLVIGHSSDPVPVKVEVFGILASESEIYVDCWCETEAARRTFRLDRISTVATEDGTKFESGEEWLRHRGEFPATLADEWGIKLPSEGQRR